MEVIDLCDSDDESGQGWRSPHQAVAMAQSTSPSNSNMTPTRRRRKRSRSAVSSSTGTPNSNSKSPSVDLTKSRAFLNAQVKSSNIQSSRVSHRKSPGRGRIVTHDRKRSMFKSPESASSVLIELESSSDDEDYSPGGRQRPVFQGSKVPKRKLARSLLNLVQANSPESSNTISIDSSDDEDFSPRRRQRPVTCVDRTEEPARKLPRSLLNSKDASKLADGRGSDTKPLPMIPSRLSFIPEPAKNQSSITADSKQERNSKEAGGRALSPSSDDQGKIPTPSLLPEDRNAKLPRVSIDSETVASEDPPSDRAVPRSSISSPFEVYECPTGQPTRDISDKPKPSSVQKPSKSSKQTPLKFYQPSFSASCNQVKLNYAISNCLEKEKKPAKQATINSWFDPRSKQGTKDVRAIGNLHKVSAAHMSVHSASPSVAKMPRKNPPSSSVAALPSAVQSSAPRETKTSATRDNFSNGIPLKKTATVAASLGLLKSEDASALSSSRSSLPPCCKERSTNLSGASQVGNSEENTPEGAAASRDTSSTAAPSASLSSDEMDPDVKAQLDQFLAEHPDEIDPDIKAQLDKFFAENKMKETDPFTYEEFLDLWDSAEKDLGYTTEEIEEGRLVRSANSKIDKADSEDQKEAQYGRLLPRGTKKMTEEVMKLKRASRFIDIGHGIGNCPLQVAYTVGCVSRGIELDSGRFLISTAFEASLRRKNEVIMENDRVKHLVGEVELVRGKLEDPNNRDLIVSCDGAFVNNAKDVFGHRSQKAKQKYKLDDYLAGLFSLMKPKSVMVTLTPLDLGPSLKDLNEARRRFGLSESSTASYYEMEEINLGPDSVSWSRKEQWIYKYTRIDQGTEDAFILCNNPRCVAACTAKPIKVSKEVEGGKIVIDTSCQTCNTHWRAGSSKRPTKTPS